MTLKIGFVGSGWIASWHLEHLSKIGGIKIVSFCDVNKERVEATARKWEAKSYIDYEKMLEEQELDVLYICIPPFAHDQIEDIVRQRQNCFNHLSGFNIWADCAILDFHANGEKHACWMK